MTQIPPGWQLLHRSTEWTLSCILVSFVYLDFVPTLRLNGYRESCTHIPTVFFWQSVDMNWTREKVQILVKK